MSKRARTEDEVLIRLEKKAGREEFSREISASNTGALIRGIAMIVVMAAEAIGANVEAVFLKVATVIFAEEGE